MEWIFRINYVFALIWAFAYATNGTWRTGLARIGISGWIGTVLISVLTSVLTNSLSFIGVTIESVIALIFFTIVFNFLFRNIKKQTDFRSSEQWTKDMIKEIRRGDK